MKHKFLFSFLFLCIFGINLSCSSDSNNITPDTPFYTEPVVTGLNLRSNRGENFGIWGRPSEVSYLGSYQSGNGSFHNYLFNFPCPNPFSDSISFFFNIPWESHGSIWIVHARLIGDKTIDENSYSGAFVYTQTPKTIRHLSNHVTYSMSKPVTWDGYDDNGKPAPSGFYRIYFKVGKIIAWRDVLLYHSLKDVPLSLQDIVKKMN